MAEVAISLKTIVVGPLEVNCYVLSDAETLDAFIIDPGADADVILDFVKRENLKVARIINTHGHFDHIGADEPVRKALNARLAIHENDARLFNEATDHGTLYGIRIENPGPPDELLRHGMELKAGGVCLRVIHTPGHTKGGVCLYDKGNKLLFTGDTLFAGGIGRTDFEGGSIEEITESIMIKILSLDEATKVYPGHGPSTTIGREKRTNPFVASL